MRKDPTPEEPETPEPPNLRFLRVLVTVLTATMIVGLVTVITLLVIRFPKPTALTMPDEISLPEGVSAETVSFTPKLITVVAGNEVLIYDRGSAELLQRIRIEAD